MTKDAKPIIVLRGLEGNNPAHVDGLQSIMQPHLGTIEMIWWVVLFITALTISIRIYKEWSAVQSTA